MMRKLKVTELGRLTVDEFKTAEKLPLALVLDNIRSVYNVGSMLRTADAFRVARVCLCGITAQPPSAEIHKTALGAEDSVDWTYYETTEQAVALLKAEGYILLAVEQVEGSIPLNQWHANRHAKYALVVGNEVKGVGQHVVDLCDAALEIPQYGTKHSLNVANTAAIVLWECFRQLNQFF